MACNRNALPYGFLPHPCNVPTFSIIRIYNRYKRCITSNGFSISIYHLVNRCFIFFMRPTGLSFRFIVSITNLLLQLNTKERIMCWDILLWCTLHGKKQSVLVQNTSMFSELNFYCPPHKFTLGTADKPAGTPSPVESTIASVS